LEKREKKRKKKMLRGRKHAGRSAAVNLTYHGLALVVFQSFRICNGKLLLPPEKRSSSGIQAVHEVS